MPSTCQSGSACCGFSSRKSSSAMTRSSSGTAFPCPRDQARRQEVRTLPNPAPKVIFCVRGAIGALLASDGFTGITDVFEAPYGGFCTTFSRSQDCCARAALVAALGKRDETMRVSRKFYACVGSNHTTLDALTDIRKRHPFTAAEIERIVVH